MLGQQHSGFGLSQAGLAQADYYSQMKYHQPLLRAMQLNVVQRTYRDDIRDMEIELDSYLKRTDSR